MTPQNKIYEAAKALISDLINKRSHFNSFQNLCRVLSEYEQSIEQPEPSLDKLAETVLREYVKFKDVNGSKSVSLLPLTIVDMMLEFIDRVNEQPEAIAGENQSALGFIESEYGKTWTNPYFGWSTDDVVDAMSEYASQQTSAKDKEITELKAEIDRLKKEVERLRKRPIVYGNPSHNQSK